MKSLIDSVLEEMRLGLRAAKSQADSAIAQMDDADLFRTLDTDSNSVAVIMRHCAGNMRSRWTEFLTTDGEKVDRGRDAEFEPPPEATREAVVREWEDGWRMAFAAVDDLRPDDLLHTITLNGEPLTVIAAVGRATRHYSSHAGQIVLLAKHFRGTSWKTLTVPRGKSREFFDATRK